MKRILPIVEGDGDTTAVPALVRRIAEARGVYDLQLLPAHKRGELPAVRRHFGAYLGAALKYEAPILWVMDDDCDQCNAVEDDLIDLQQRARQAYAPQPVEFALMVKEFESLFLSDKETVHQVKLVHQLDLDRLRERSPSFQRFEQAVLRLLEVAETP